MYSTYCIRDLVPFVNLNGEQNRDEQNESESNENRQSGRAIHVKFVRLFLYGDLTNEHFTFTLWESILFVYVL